MMEEKEKDEAIAQINSDQRIDFKEDRNWLKDFAGVAGNMMEWYDFALFGAFSDILGEVFFPLQEGNAGTIESFTVFGCAFLFRPLGGMIIGYIGDKYSRKLALEISIILMAIPTFTMGCLPSFDQVGWLSPILLTLIRILQGLSVGGQLMSSLIFTTGQHPKSQCGFYAGVVFATSSLGALLGSIVATIMREIFSHEQLVSWAWRIPFLSGILAGVSALYLRFYCQEEDHEKLTVHPIKEAFHASNRRSLISCCLVPILCAAGGYLTFVWLPIFMNSILEPPIPHSFLISCVAQILCILFLPLAGALSDAWGPSSIMICSAISTALLGPLMMYILLLHNMYYALFAQILLGASVNLYTAPMAAWLTTSFPPDIRLTAISIGYNIALSTAGGFSPAVATIMVDRFGTTSPGFLFSVAASISLLGICISPKSDIEEVSNLKCEDEMKTQETQSALLSTSSSNDDGLLVKKEII